MPAPSDAFLRFRKSMQIDYDAWKEGQPYDLPALTDVSPDERDSLVDELAAKSALDWRDVDALRALGTPKALKRLGKAATTGSGGGPAAALVHAIETEGWSEARERRLIEMLENMKGMDESSDRLFGLCEQHLTPAIRAQLMRNARSQSDPTIRYSSGAFLLYLAGHVDSRFVFDADHRPHLLNLNSADDAAREAALAWLEDKVANPGA